MSAEEKYVYMTQTPVKKLIPRLAIPTIISMLVTSFYNMADSYFVGKLNTSATGAVGVVFSLMAIIQAVGFMFGQGSGVCVSQKLASKENDEASRLASGGFFCALIVGTIIMIAGLIFREKIADFLGATETIKPYAISYMSIILLGAPAITTSFVLNNQLRYQGSATYAMVGIVSGGIINIVLNPILMFSLNMGITGAAVATIISQYFSLVLLWIGSKKGSAVQISIKNFDLNIHRWITIITKGCPSLARQGLASVAAIALNYAAKEYGDAAIAAMSVVSRVTMFINSALIGFGQGFQPVCAFNYGAKNYDRVINSFWFCIKVSIIFLTMTTLIGIFFAPNIVSMFTKNDVEVIDIGSRALRCVASVFVTNSWIVMSNMMLQATGKFVKGTILAAARQGLFFLPLIFIMPHIWGIDGIISCQMVSDVLTFILAIPLSVGVLKEMKKGI